MTMFGFRMPVCLKVIGSKDCTKLEYALYVIIYQIITHMWKHNEIHSIFYLSLSSFCQITFLYAFGRNNTVLTQSGCVDALIYMYSVLIIHFVIINYCMLYSLYTHSKMIHYIQNKFVCMTCLHLWYYMFSCQMICKIYLTI